MNQSITFPGNDLYKQSLVRCAMNAKKGPVCESPPENSEKYGRAFQIIEVSEWIDNSVECAKWFSARSGNLSNNNISTFAKKISLAVGLPCVGMLRQMIRYTAFSNIPSLHSELDGDTLIPMLSTTLWIYCISTFPQLLVLIYGLYDVFDDDSLDLVSITTLISDILVEDNIDTPDNGQSNRKDMIKVNEIVDSLMEYSMATKLISVTHRKKSTSEESVDGVADRRSPCPSDNGVVEGVSCKEFVTFFMNKKGLLWHLLSFQLKLQESCFGVGAWKVVREWVHKHTQSDLSVSRMRFGELHYNLGQELAEYLRYQSRSNTSLSTSTVDAIDKTLSMSSESSVRSRSPTIDEDIDASMPAEFSITNTHSHSVHHQPSHLKFESHQRSQPLKASDPASSATTANASAGQSNSQSHHVLTSPVSGKSTASSPNTASTQTSRGSVSNNNSNNNNSNPGNSAGNRSVEIRPAQKSESLTIILNLETVGPVSSPVSPIHRRHSDESMISSEESDAGLCYQPDKYLRSVSDRGSSFLLEEPKDALNQSVIAKVTNHLRERFQQRDDSKEDRNVIVKTVDGMKSSSGKFTNINDASKVTSSSSSVVASTGAGASAGSRRQKAESSFSTFVGGMSGWLQYGSSSGNNATSNSSTKRRSDFTVRPISTF